MQKDCPGKGRREDTMISNINEGPMRAVMKMDPIGPIHDQEVNRQRADALRQARLVEKSASSARNEPKESEENDKSEYKLENEKVVFKKYNNKGDMVYQLPPSSTPIDERV
jgi:hypothetical protein